MKYFKKYELFYRNYGLRRRTEFLAPKVLLQSDVIFPMYSIIHFYTGTSLMPTPELPLLTNTVNPGIINILDFKANDVIYKKKPLNVNSFTNKLIKENSKITIIKPNKFKLPFKNKGSFLRHRKLIYNYNNLENLYRIPDRKDSEYNIFKYTYETIFNTIEEADNDALVNGININHFLYLPLPNILLPFVKLRTYNKTIDTKYFKLFYNTPRMVLAELFKIFSKEDMKNSIFSKLKRHDNITLTFIKDNKVTFINLKKLLSYSEEYPEYENNKKYKPLELARLFYYYLNTIYNTEAFHAEDIISEKYVTAIKNSSISNNKDLDIKSILIDNYDKLNLEDKRDEETDEHDTINDKDINKVLKSVINDDIDKEANNKLALIDNPIKTKDSEYSKYANSSLEEFNNKKLTDEIDNLYTNLENSKKFNKNKLKTLRDKYNKLLDKKLTVFNSKIKDNLEVKSEELQLTDEDVTINTFITKVDKNINKNIKANLDKKYINNILPKDIISSIVSIQRSGHLLINDIDAELVKDTLGDYYSFDVKVFDPNTGINNSLKFNIPKIEENGEFKISNNTYMFRSQRSDIPIKKVDFNRVLLSSAYGKLFIDKAPYKKMDRGYSIVKSLMKNSNVSNLVLGNKTIPDADYHDVYGLFIRYIKSFNYKVDIDNRIINFNFNYTDREHLLKNKDKLTDLETKNRVLVGLININNKEHYLLLDNDGELYYYDNSFVKKYFNIFDLLKLDKLTNEYSLLKVYKYYVPVVTVLAYYMGLNNLLKSSKVKYEFSDIKRRPDTEDNIVFIRFQDQSLIVYPKTKEEELLWRGWEYYKSFKDYPIDIFNNKEEFNGFFSDQDLRLVEITEIKLLETLFVDPVTASILTEMNMPNTFIGLLLKANEMLINENYIHPNSIRGFTIKGYERVPQIIYKTMVTTIKKKANQEFFGRSTIDYNPYEIYNVINSDNTVMLVDDINPIANIKQIEDTTATGIFGRATESLTKPTRELRPENIGILSEAVKDNGEVGIAASLSANPTINNLRGLPNIKDDINYTNVLSTSALLAPFSITDDVKRANFISIMNSHVISIDNRIPYPITTGYDVVIANKADKKFIGVAKDKGKVIKVTNNKIVVKYKDSEESYKYEDWVGKEESNSSYKHILVANVKEGDSVEKDDVLYYDKGFFVRNIFNPKRVSYSPTTVARTLLIELNETDEDASVMSSKFSQGIVSKFIKVRSIIIDNDNKIDNLKQIGDKVDYQDILFTISSNIDTNEDFDKNTLDLLSGFIKTSPRAKVDGKIVNIKIFYNAEEKDLSKSIKSLIDTLPKNRVKKVGANYSIKGIPLRNNGVEIKYYIETTKPMSIGDKGVLASQLKTVVSDITEDDLKTTDGRDVDMLFSSKAISARIVNSPFLMGYAATLLRLVSEEAVKIYDS